MTNERLIEILKPYTYPTAGKVNISDALECMKKAVNEALDEAHDKAIFGMFGEKKSILNLKVK